MSGDVRCWGDNFAGQLGNDTRDPSSAPNPVLTVTDAVSAGAGANHTCATNRDGEAACWGANGLAQIGNGEEPDDVLSPATVPHVSGAIGVSGGTSHTCALLDDGGVTCWGSNSTGQLGVGSFGGELPPTPVANLLDAVEVATGAFHTCARRTNGQVVCWGYNEYGQLGDNSNSSSSTPVVVEGLGDAISIAAGGVHSCAVRENGGVVCWGSNDNDQLGDGTGAQSLVPVAADISNALEIVAGTNFTCARRAADATTVEVYCWGANTSGQLGNGTMDPSPTPTPVIGL